MPTLVRTLRLRDLLFLFIGSVIGSGIFLSPDPILKLVNGSVGLSMLVWIAGGVMFLLGALTSAELAAANPLTAPRVFYAMSKDNLFFKTLAEVHPRFHTPANAIVALCVWSAVLTFAGKFSELISGVIFIGWIFYGLGAAAIFPLRAALGGLTKALPYRVPGYPWTPIVFLLAAAAVVGNAIFLATRDPQEFRHVLAALVLMGLGIPAYFFWRYWNAQKTHA